MPRPYLNRLVQEHKRFYSSRIDDLRRDINYLERVLSSALQPSQESLSGTNLKLSQRVALRQTEIGIDYHVMAYVLSKYMGKRDETHLAKARVLLKKMQEVQLQLTPRG